MKNFAKPQNELLKELCVDPKVGLSAVQVKERLEKYGENRLREKKKKSNLARFFD